MKKYLWVVVLALSSLSAGTVAADNSHAQQDQVFLDELAQQAKAAPMSPVLAESPSPFAPLSVCNGAGCNSTRDCNIACGEPGLAYCDASHQCRPL
jgi:hypothetical protein